MDGDKRVAVKDRENWVHSSSSRFSRSPFLNPKWWEMHRYSWKDIEDTLSATSDPLLLWQVLASEGCDIPPTAIKIPWSQRMKLDYTDKAGALKKLNHIMKFRYSDRVAPLYPNKLTAPFQNLVPPLPTQILNDEEWNAFIRLFGERIVNPARMYADVFTWRGIKILPYTFCHQNKLLQVVHVSTIKDYCSERGTPTNEINTPFTFYIGKNMIQYYDNPGTFWIQLPEEFMKTARIPEAC
jgi:hypothetical protein